MLTVDEIKNLLAELDGELPVLDEGQRLADRQRVLALVSNFVRDWKERGYSYQQIAEKLRDKGIIRTTGKVVRETAEGRRRRKRRVKTQKSLGAEDASNGAVTVAAPVDEVAKVTPESQFSVTSSGSKSEGGSAPASSGGRAPKRTAGRQPSKTLTGTSSVSASAGKNAPVSSGGQAVKRQLTETVLGSGRFVPREDSDEL